MSWWKKELFEKYKQQLGEIGIEHIAFMGDIEKYERKKCEKTIKEILNTAKRFPGDTICFLPSGRYFCQKTHIK